MIPLSKTALGKELSNPTVPPTSPKSAVNQILHSILTATAMSQFVTPELLRSNWDEAVKVINQYNDPGRFTTLIAFEWTSIPNGRNMHRNVFWRDDKGPSAPFSAFDSIFPEDLWTYQEISSQQRSTTTSPSPTTAMSPMAGCTRRTEIRNRRASSTLATPTRQHAQRTADRDHPDQGKSSEALIRCHVTQR